MTGSRLYPAALRASLGHPDPFPLKYVEIGNEDFFAADTYLAYRWPDFVGNLSAAFPDIGVLSDIHYLTSFHFLNDYV